MGFILFKISDQLIKPSNDLLLFTAFFLVIALFVRRKWPVWVAAFGLAATLILSVVPVGEWMLIPLEDSFPKTPTPPAKVDGILFMSDRVNVEISNARGSMPMVDPAVTTMLALARHYPNAKLVLTGIGESTSAYTESSKSLVQHYLESVGFDASRVIYEDKARSGIADQLERSMAVAKPQPDQHWLVVQQAFHMPQTIGRARHMGWNLDPYPIAYRTTGHVNLLAPHLRPTLYLWEIDDALKEWITLGLMHEGGITKKWLPGPDKATTALKSAATAASG